MDLRPYEFEEEHIRDLIELLDLYIYRLFLRDEEERKEGLSKYKGLGITPEDVSAALGVGKTISVTDEELKVKMDLEDLSERVHLRVKATQEQGDICLRFEDASLKFGLNQLQRLLLLLGISTNLNPKYMKIYGYLNDHMSRKRPTAGLLPRLLDCDQDSVIEIVNQLSSENNFTKFFLDNWVIGDQNFGLFDRDLIINRRMESYILGNDKLDPDIAYLCSIYDVSKDLEPPIGIEDQLNSVIKILENYYNSIISSHGPVYVQLIGKNGSGRKHLVYNVAKRLGRPVIVADLSGIGHEVNLKEALNGIVREAVLRNSMIVVEGLDTLLIANENVAEIVDTFFELTKVFADPIFITSNRNIRGLSHTKEHTVTRIELKNPDYKTRIKLWEYYKEQLSIKEVDSKDLSNKFALTPEQIKGSLIEFRSKNIVQENDGYTIYKACNEQIEHALEKKATKIDVVYKWEDIVLPTEPKTIMEAVCNQVKYRQEVLEGWGFGNKLPYGKGISLVCSGPPGTGKTMSAQVIAGVLNLELYKIDISKVVSKYIGETEKNLGEIFEEAKLSNAILFFDEADALFGKRTQVNESKDRYANIEVSYLLQKIEEYDGITILATNYLNNIDKAFLRRISYIIAFPFPDYDMRLEIWKKAFPKEAPISKDVDYEFLAKTFELAGGNIRNVSLNSAYLAISEGSDIKMKHVLASTRSELQKMDKLLLKEDLKEYAYLLEDIS